MSGLPRQCYSGGLIGAGLCLLATYAHKDQEIPAHCVATSLAAVGGVTWSLAHHADFCQLPEWYCTVGAAAMIAIGTYAYKAHIEKENDAVRVPMHCVLASIVGAGLLSAGVTMALKK